MSPLFVVRKALSTCLFKLGWLYVDESAKIAAVDRRFNLVSVGG